jgi:hypothetical protein
MTEIELKSLQDKVGQDATNAINRALNIYDEKAKQFATEAVKGTISESAFKAHQDAMKSALEEVKEIAAKQGTTLQEIALKVTGEKAATKTIAEVLQNDAADLNNIKASNFGFKEYLISLNTKGEFVMKPINRKAAGPNATVANVGGAGNAASIFQNIDSTSLLRLGGDAPIISQYRNSKWVFDLCNVINAGYDQLMAMYYEEGVKQGASATTAEGVTRPLEQYNYTLQTKTYKKESVMIGFTDEFSIDFQRLQSDILGKGRVDLINRINSQVLTNLTAAATAYNTQVAYKAARGGAITANYNDYFAIDALSAQVDSATFGQGANAAVLSTYKNHVLGTQMDSTGRWLTPPPSLSGISYVGNPAMGTDDLMVGDFKQYNIILRGGLVLRVGYNGNDFANGQFSTVMDQYYFDYISSLRTPAIVKGATFAAVKTAITT